MITGNSNDQPTPKIRSSRGHAFWEIVQTTLLAFILAQLVVRFVAQPYHVEGASMQPTFHDGDYILTDKLSYLLREPRRGEVITFKAPINSQTSSGSETEFIKRVIGLPGDSVEFLDEAIVINNEKLEESYLPFPSLALGGNTIKGASEVTIPEGYYLVLGDNRGHSLDSRSFGFIKGEDIGGRAIFRYWPLSDVQTIIAPNY